MASNIFLFGLPAPDYAAAVQACAGNTPLYAKTKFNFRQLYTFIFHSHQIQALILLWFSY